jgi:hypothetical protein
MPEVQAKVELRHEAPRKTIVELTLTSAGVAPTSVCLAGEENGSWTSTSRSFVIMQRSETK